MALDTLGASGGGKVALTLNQTTGTDMTGADRESDEELDRMVYPGASTANLKGNRKNFNIHLLTDPKPSTPTSTSVQYDLSFAYSFKWEEPGRQIREALKVLLNREGDLADSVKTAKKRGQSPESQKLSSAALEAAKIRFLLAINPNTPPPVLEHLTRNAPVPLLERIAENPRTHSTTLARLSMHEEPAVRAAVAENLNTSIKTIWKLARDPHCDVRFRVAESYSVPLAVLKVLSEDSNPFVAHRAQTTIYRILKEVSELRTA